MGTLMSMYSVIHLVINLSRTGDEFPLERDPFSDSKKVLNILKCTNKACS